MARSKTKGPRSLKRTASPASPCLQKSQARGPGLAVPMQKYQNWDRQPASKASSKARSAGVSGAGISTVSPVQEDR